MNTSSDSADRPSGSSPGERGDASGDPGEDGSGAARRPAEHDAAYDPFIDEETEDEEPLESEETVAAAPAARPRREGGLFGAETFALAAVLAVAAALVGPRLVQSFSSVTAQDQVSAISSAIAGDAVTALLGMVLAAVSLALANEGSRPWTRWMAGASLGVGLVFVIVSVVAYMLVPAPAPAPTGPTM